VLEVELIMRVSAVIAAGGQGTRVGGDVPKQLQDLGGKTLLTMAVKPFEECRRVDEIVIVIPEAFNEIESTMGIQCDTPLRFVSGGSRRQDSVALGVDNVRKDTDVVLVHDAARPFCTVSLIEHVIDATIEAGAVVPAIRVIDTVKEVAVDDTDGSRFIEATLPRDRIYLAQTPQGFALNVLRDAVELGRNGATATDEAGLVEKSGHAVRLIEGDMENLKVTTSDDLKRARARISNHVFDDGPRTRIGFGYDSHRMAHGRRLVLGGVDIPYRCGLDGHSDADAVCHAITDAVLGAVAAGDIGQHFPDTDPQWKDVSSIDLLSKAVAIVSDLGFFVGNIDVVVIAEQPRIGPHVQQMKKRLSRSLGVSSSLISIKGKTAEGMDSVGRGEAIAVHAVATVIQR
tara:strand:+ start:2271 stop:3473 length:1203 start_codon:yes stop_codon:yes gene_type:complete